MLTHCTSVAPVQFLLSPIEVTWLQTFLFSSVESPFHWITVSTFAWAYWTVTCESNVPARWAAAFFPRTQRAETSRAADIFQGHAWAAQPHVSWVLLPDGPNEGHTMKPGSTAVRSLPGDFGYSAKMSPSQSILRKEPGNTKSRGTWPNCSVLRGGVARRAGAFATESYCRESQQCWRQGQPDDVGTVSNGMKVLNMPPSTWAEQLHAPPGYLTARLPLCSVQPNVLNMPPWTWAEQLHAPPGYLIARLRLCSVQGNVLNVPPWMWAEKLHAPPRVPDSQIAFVQCPTERLKHAAFNVSRTAARSSRVPDSQIAFVQCPREGLKHAALNVSRTPGYLTARLPLCSVQPSVLNMPPSTWAEQLHAPPGYLTARWRPYSVQGNVLNVPPWMWAEQLHAAPRVPDSQIAFMRCPTELP